jgi:hypothetical protein
MAYSCIKQHTFTCIASICDLGYVTYSYLHPHRYAFKIPPTLVIICTSSHKHHLYASLYIGDLATSTPQNTVSRSTNTTPMSRTSASSSHAAELCMDQSCLTPEDLTDILSSTQRYAYSQPTRNSPLPKVFRLI